MQIVALRRRSGVPALVAVAGGLALSMLPRGAWGHDEGGVPGAASEEEPVLAAPSASASEVPVAPAAASAEPKPTEIVVAADKGFTAASADEVRNRDLMLRPRTRPGDVLEVVPGLFAVQHAGGGKANQYFIRGFDADHGTDIALFVDGVPVNMVSHGHGQGFADLHFVIPELVSTLSAQKGPYSAKYGDFATAAAVDLRYYDHLHESSVTFQAGRFGIFRGLFMVAPQLGDDWSTIVAGEAYADNGPFTNPERLRRFNGFARVTRHMGPGTLSLSMMTYTSGWNASGQVPNRALGTAELPTEFDSIDPSEGGQTQRHQFSVMYRYLNGEDEARALVYAVKYRFALFSNFTLFNKNAVTGDEIEQNDDRTMLGTHWSFKRTKKLGPITTATTFGLQMRSDSIENDLHHAYRRKLTDTAIEDSVTESSIGLYGEEDVKLTDWLRVVGGVRLDRFDVNVKDHLEAPGASGPSTSGITGAALASPKASMVLSPLVDLRKTDPVTAWDVYLNYGRGFHSNDARGATKRYDPANPSVSLLTIGTGYEVGTRINVLRRLDLAAALFRLDLDSETVWNGDEGTTVSVGPTRRTGVELEGRLKLLNWLFFDADATFTKATFRENAGNGGALALAPTRTFAAGVSVRHPDGWFGAFRVRAIAKRPANDGQDRVDKPLDAEGWTLFDATGGYRYKDLEGAIDVRNVFNTRWKEVQFANTSRLRSEVDAGRPGQQDLHYTPGWPFTILARVTAYF